MMYGYGYGVGWVWMTLMPVVWIALLGAVAWAVVTLVRRPGGHEHAAPGQETPQEILDRRFACGEIDGDTYAQARNHLAGRESGTS
ncbi:MAG TPA: hypothetical protein VJT49_07570 [Amycolatopsis sp.]|uniref:SHOCT domain-containing protein n=1 Tax=Amycolatopsis sp. TaxID=37632 RepID=UPI002B4991EB|nr:hypothetical protein [Amycolatopsis sp.]HKS44966.1 hypothetical protein [Amycolatopsis sp.]